MQERPISVTIFGILNIGFALFGLFGLLVSKAFLSQASNMPGNSIMTRLNSDPMYAGWMKIATPIGGVVSVILLAAGIGLLMMKNWARIASIGYGIYGIIGAGIGGMIMFKVFLPLLGQNSGGPQGIVVIITIVASIIGVVIGAAYPILLIIFMTRPKIVAAFCAAQPPPVT
jgi:hypothetical protein